LHDKEPVMHRVIHRDWGWAKTHPTRLAALVAAFNSIAQSTVAAPQSLNDPLLDRPSALGDFLMKL